MKDPRWTEELELGLVRLYKKFRCLWMISLPAYNDLDSRYAAYVKIVEALRPGFHSLTVPKVVYKIRDLRYSVPLLFRRYCVELTKVERAAACGGNYTPNVPWFKVMHAFLELRFRTDKLKDCCAADSTEEKLNYDYRGTRLTSSTCQTIYENNLKMEESKSTVGEFEESGKDAAKYCTEVYDRRGRCRGAKESEEVEKIEEPHGDLFGNEIHPQARSSGIKMGKKTTETLFFAKGNEGPEFQQESGNRLVEIRGKKRSNESDEFNAFAMSIGSQLKTLDSELATKLEIKILMILNEERMRSVE